MTDSDSVSRRQYLGAVSALGITALSGCVTDRVGGFYEQEEEPNEYSEITGITVRQTPDGYNQNEDYFAIVSDDLQEEYNINSHQQVRLRIQATGMEQWRLRPSIFTTKVEPDFTSEEENTIWLSNTGLERITADPGMVLNLLPFATTPNYQALDTAEENNEFVEQSVTKNEHLLACASSGGQIYNNTELQALHVSSESNASSWITAGFDDKDRAHERWHVRPTLIDATAYNEVRYLIDDQEYDYAVNFLGMPDEEVTETIRIGGLVQESRKTAVAEEIRARFEGTDVDITVTLEDSGRWSATDTRNIVNRFTDAEDNGIQIAQSQDIHNNHWKKVANAVLTVFNS